jgi:hypothetical protein
MPTTPATSSPCAWEKAIKEPVGPIYGPEDLVSGWVTKKRKRDSGCPRPAKRRATVPGGKPDFSDADDEDDENLPSAEGQEDSRVPPHTCRTSPPPGAGPGLSDSPPPAGLSLSPALADLVSIPSSEMPNETVTALVISSVEGARGGAVERASVLVVPSSQDSTSSQSGSDSQNAMAELDKRARAALHNMESATNVHISQNHRSGVIEHSLALGKRDTLENFRQACSYWRKHHMSRTPQLMALEGPGSVLPYEYSKTRHPALSRFSRAYHAAQTTVDHRAVLDVLYRADLAYLHDVNLQTLEALSRFTIEETDNTSSRPRDLFNADIRNAAADQMFWACYPELEGKPRSYNKSLGRKFSTTLEHAEKWHALREEFSIGMFALVPRGANTWFERLPFKDLPLYLRLVAEVNPVAMNMAEMIADRVLSLWRREEAPERLLRLEHLETVDEISFKANPSKLLEEINVGCIPGNRRGTEGSQMGRAVTMPAGIDENDTAALDAAFAWGIAGVSSDMQLAQVL